MAFSASSTYDKEGNVKNYSKYIFEDKLLLKTIKYSPNDILEYELFNKYDKNNNRISTYYQNKKKYILLENIIIKSYWRKLFMHLEEMLLLLGKVDLLIMI